MRRRKSRRRSRSGHAKGRRTGGKKIQVNFFPILVIIVLSVCAGYLTAKYIVYPFLGYESADFSVIKKQPQKETKATTPVAKATTVTTVAKTTPPTTAMVEDQVDVGGAGAYAIQFGSYSAESAAKKAISDLKNSGIKATMMKKAAAYKVIGKRYESKEAAQKALKKLDPSIGAFITNLT